MTTNINTRNSQHDCFLSKAEICELGLEEAHPNFGRSWEEIEQQKIKGAAHGK